MSSMLENFCDCYLNFISLPICLSVKKQRTDQMLESTKIWKTLTNHYCLLRQTPPQQTTHHMKPGQPPGKSRRERYSLALLFQMCSYQLHTFLNMLKQREDHRSGKLEGRKKIPSGKDLKLIFKNVQKGNACRSSIKVQNTIEVFCSDAK